MIDLATLTLTADTSGLLKGKKALEETIKAAAATESPDRDTRGGFVK